MIFDNSKLRSVVPDYVATITFEQAAHRRSSLGTMRMHHGSRMLILTLMDKLCEAFRAGN